MLYRTCIKKYTQAHHCIVLKLAGVSYNIENNVFILNQTKTILFAQYSKSGNPYSKNYLKNWLYENQI